MVTKELMDYFKFTEADLAANKTGALTAQQKAKLGADAKSGKTGGILFGLLLLGAAAIFPLSFFGNCLFGHNCKTDPGISGIIGLIVLIIVNLIWVGIWGGIGVALIIGSFSKTNYKLKLVEGPINIVKELRSGSHGHEYTEYELHVSGQVFDVDEGLADVIMQGEYLALYYLVDASSEDTPYQILSAEKLAAGN